MKIICSIILCSILNLCIAQTPAFNYQNLSPEHQFPGYAHEDNDGNFIITAAFDNSCKVVKLNDQGNFVDSRIFETSGFESRIWHIVQGDENMTTIGTQTYIQSDSTLLWMMELDDDLNVVSESLQFLSRSYVDLPIQCNNQYADTLICMGTGSVNGAFPINIFGIKYINNQEVTITDIQFNNLVYDLVVSPTNHNIYYLNGFSIIKTDAAFNFIDIFQKPFVYNLQGDFQPLSDSTFLHSGRKIQFESEHDLGMGIVDYDLNGIESVVVGAIVDSLVDPALSKSIDIFNDYIYVGGTSKPIPDQPFNLQESNSQFILGKFDKDLNEIWTRYYGNDAYYYMSFLQATRDGGCIMIGSKHDFINNTGIAQLYVLKVSEDGDIVNTTTVPFEQKSFSIYPNPAIDYMVLEFVGNGVLPDNATVEMYDLLGRKVLQQEINNITTTMDVAALQAATYVVIVKDESGQVIVEERVVKVE